MKTCNCQNKFNPSHPLQVYCSDKCRNEAKKSARKRWKRKVKQSVRPLWSIEETDLIKQLYPQSKETIGRIAYRLGRTQTEVKMKAKRMGLRKSEERRKLFKLI